MSKGERLDLLVVSRGILNSREKARAAIMDGAILVNGQKLTKPGTSVSEKAKIELIDQKKSRYKSRGGLKLEKALEYFHINVHDRICIDIGASTGGFTDCLLKHGAARVYAIDVGYGQLDWQLRNDERVVVKERLNARYLSYDDLYHPHDRRANLAVIDVSFISLARILPACSTVLDCEYHEIICLVKPQFEAGRENVEKGGVVRSKATHKLVLQSVVESAGDAGLHCQGITYSPIKGPKGNIEFLIHLTNKKSQKSLDIEKLIEEAHVALNR